ncbi:hypothetical protein CTI14_68875, partial [Methylobacterium radiotolerans]
RSTSRTGRSECGPCARRTRACSWPSSRVSTRRSFAIRPYPAEWIRTLNLKDRTVRVRPVRPEDEGLFLAFFKGLDPE